MSKRVRHYVTCAMGMLRQLRSRSHGRQVVHLVTTPSRKIVLPTTVVR